MIKIVAYDIAGHRPNGLHAPHQEDVGTFESVQMTGAELRDPDGKTILDLLPSGSWFNPNTNHVWYDWTVEVAP